MSAQQTTEQLLEQRKTTHGEYADHARVTQALLDVAHGATNWPALPPMIRETLHMTFHKVGRVLTGNPYLRDHFDDISGYSVLISQRINEDQTGMRPWPPEPSAADAVRAVLRGAGAELQRGDERVMQGDHPHVPDPRDADGVVRYAPGVGQSTLVPDEHFLGTEPLTRERLERAFTYAFNVTGLDAKVGKADYEFAAKLAAWMPAHREGELLTVDLFGRRLGIALQQSGIVYGFDPNLAVRGMLLEPTLSWLRDTTGVQVMARVYESVASPYSTAYDAMARDLGLPREKCKRLFTGLMLHAHELDRVAPPPAQETSWLLSREEDGSEVHFSSYSGDASQHGAWGQISLRFSHPERPVESRIRVYLEERDPVAMVCETLGLSRGEQMFLSVNVENAYRGQSYGAVSRALSGTAAFKGGGQYEGSSAQFAAHVFILARMLATSTDQGGAPLGVESSLASQNSDDSGSSLS